MDSYLILNIFKINNKAGKGFEPHLLNSKVHTLIDKGKIHTSIYVPEMGLEALS